LKGQGNEKNLLVQDGTLLSCPVRLSIRFKLGLWFGGLPQNSTVSAVTDIEYDAPADGTFYLVDLTSGKFVVTEDVTAETP
jgi:hypothetical protein